MRALQVVFVLMLTAACSTSGRLSGTIPTAELVDGSALDLPPPNMDLIARADAMALDDEMHAFIEDYIGDARQKTVVLSQLLRGMTERGFFTLQYVVGDTHTARETFRLKRGNCMSFTLLFVALAREAGLRVSYQILEVPPVWNAEAELMVIANHINALIEMPSGRDYTVDFNESTFNGRSPSRKVADEYALALFFNNLGAEALLAGDHPLALHYFRTALVLDPNVADPWVNLGVLYVRHGLPRFAEAAYQHALDVDASQRSALTNLAALYESIGEVELAAEYDARIRRYQQRNPYYHYARAQEAFAADLVDEAQAAVRRAIKLKGDEHEFYYLLARTQIELGQLENAKASLERARINVTTDALRKKYEGELARLDSVESVTAAAR
jgi:tetratricopeptide (TPR) repeat protein